MQVELGFENGVIGDIFSVPGYEIRGHVVAQVYSFFYETVSCSKKLKFL